MYEEPEILEEIVIPNVGQVSDYFLANNNSLKIVDFPKLKTIGNLFLKYNNSLLEVNLESLEKVGNNFLLSPSTKLDPPKNSTMSKDPSSIFLSFLFTSQNFCFANSPHVGQFHIRLIISTQ